MKRKASITSANRRQWPSFLAIPIPKNASTKKRRSFLLKSDITNWDLSSLHFAIRSEARVRDQYAFLWWSSWCHAIMILIHDPQDCPQVTSDSFYDFKTCVPQLSADACEILSNFASLRKYIFLFCHNFTQQQWCLRKFNKLWRNSQEVPLYLPFFWKSDGKLGTSNYLRW